MKKQKVKTAKGRTTSSTRWLERQLNDPYVKKAKTDGWRSRAAYKLIEMDEKLKLLKPGVRVVDLGAAPGGWTQVCASKKASKIVALDILEMDPMKDVTILQMDFNDNNAPDRLKEALGGQADLVISDMAPNTTGIKKTDHLRMMSLVEMGYHFAKDVLAPGGTFLAKVFAGGTENTLLAEIKKDFTTIKHVKPPASRQDSSEKYLVAQGYRGCIKE